MGMVVRSAQRMVCLGSLVAAGLLTGCGVVRTPYDGGTPVTTPSVSNNWQFQATNTSGGNSLGTLTALSGSVAVGTSSSGSIDSVLQATSPCYLPTANVVPLSGTVNGSTVSVRSFAVQSQFLSLNGTLDASQANLTGTYEIDGGCSNGEKGTFTGARYRALTGTYTGSVKDSSSVIHTVTLTSTQGAPTGQGNFPITGSATITGFSCFSSANVATNGGYISGNTLLLTLNDGGNTGTTIQLNGTVDSGATSITIKAPTVSGGFCNGTLPSVTLTRQ
jgi:hypothetical protein